MIRTLILGAVVGLLALFAAALVLARGEQELQHDNPYRYYHHQ